MSKNLFQEFLNQDLPTGKPAANKYDGVPVPEALSSDNPFALTTVVNPWCIISKLWGLEQVGSPSAEWVTVNDQQRYWLKQLNKYRSLLKRWATNPGMQCIASDDQAEIDTILIANQMKPIGNKRQPGEYVIISIFEMMQNWYAKGSLVWLEDNGKRTLTAKFSLSDNFYQTRLIKTLSGVTATTKKLQVGPDDIQYLVILAENEFGTSNMPLSDLFSACEPVVNEIITGAYENIKYAGPTYMPVIAHKALAQHDFLLNMEYDSRSISASPSKNTTIIDDLGFFTKNVEYVDTLRSGGGKSTVLRNPIAILVDLGNNDTVKPSEFSIVQVMALGTDSHVVEGSDQINLWAKAGRLERLTTIDTDGEWIRNSRH